jgi:competence protein ComGC
MNPQTVTKFFRLTIIIVVVLIILQIGNYFRAESNITDEGLSNTFDYLSNTSSEFVIRDQDRYSTDRNFNPELKDPLLQTRKLGHSQMKSSRSDIKGKSCGKMYDFSYDVKQSAGANNTYQDMSWNESSPRTTLQNNCMSCQHGKNNNFNGPSAQSESEPVGFEFETMYEPL